MHLADAVLLLAAGLAAGTVNAIAGGGSLITFPTLVAVGMSPLVANVTNSLAMFPGYVGSVLGSRTDLDGQRRRVRRLLPTAVAGGAAGCALLLATPARTFEVVVPFLVLGAAAVLAFQQRLRRVVGQPQLMSSRRQEVSLQALVAAGSVYGGYFGAALGVMLVAALGLLLAETMARISALKNVISAVVGLTTVVAFGIFGPVNWAAVGILAPATVVGGYLGARLARRLPSTVLRTLIVVFGTVIGVILLIRAF
jgi:uncharacterized membrane protein YfcA